MYGQFMENLPIICCMHGRVPGPLPQRESGDKARFQDQGRIICTVLRGAFNHCLFPGVRQLISCDEYLGANTDKC